MEEKLEEMKHCKAMRKKRTKRIARPKFLSKRQVFLYNSMRE